MSEKPPKPKPPPEPEPGPEQSGTFVGTFTGTFVGTFTPDTEPEPEPDPENLVSVPAGTYHGFPKELKNGKHYRAEGKVTIRPASGADDTLRVVEKRELVLEGFRFERAERAGVFVADSSDIVFIECESSDNEVQGFLSVDSENLDYLSCRAHRNHDQHGFYISGSCRGLTMLDCEATGNGRTGLQINSEGAGHGAERVVVERFRAADNQQQDQGAEVNLMGCGTAASPLQMADITLRPEGGKRALYAGPYAANRPCYGTIDRLDASGHVENESPNTLEIIEV